MRIPGLRRGVRASAVEFVVLIAIVGALAGVMTYSLSGFSHESQTSACEADTRSLRNAEEANFAQAGSYDIQAVLVDHGLLSHVSAWHGVRLLPALPGSAVGTFSITVISNRCGHNGDEVGSNASDR